MRYRPAEVTAAILGFERRLAPSAPIGAIAAPDARRLFARPPAPRHHDRDDPRRRDPGQRGRRARRAHPGRARGRRRVRARSRPPSTAGADHGGPRPGPARVPARRLGRRPAAGRSPRRSSRPRRIASGSCTRACPDALAPRASRTSAGGRADRALDTSTPIVAGTYAAARGAVDVALTTADLVLGGETAAYGLCRPPGHHAARSMYGGYCFFNNAAIAAAGHRRADRRAGRDPRRRLSPRQRHAADLLAPRRRAVRLAACATPTAQYPYFLGRRRRDRRGAGRAARTSTCRCPRAARRGLPRGARPRPRARSRHPGSVLVVSLGFDTYGLDPIGDFALTDRRSTTRSGAGSAALGRRLVILQEGGYHRARARRQRAGLAARRRGRARPLPRSASRRRWTAPEGYHRPAMTEPRPATCPTTCGARRRDRERDRRRPRGAPLGRRLDATGGSRPAAARDPGRDRRGPDREGLLGTPDRVHRMYAELTAGYHVDPERLINGAVFEVDYCEMVVVKDIPFYSLCEHHLLPFFGTAHVAYIPRRPRDRAVQDPADRRDVRAPAPGPGAADPAGRATSSWSGSSRRASAS